MCEAREGQIMQSIEQTREAILQLQVAQSGGGDGTADYGDDGGGGGGGAGNYDDDDGRGSDDIAGGRGGATGGGGWGAAGDGERGHADGDRECGGDYSYGRDDDERSDAIDETEEEEKEETGIEGITKPETQRKTP